MYAQLLGFKDQVLGETRLSMENMEKDASGEVARTDVRVLEAEHKRLQRRAEYWERRRRQLEGAPGQP